MDIANRTDPSPGEPIWEDRYTPSLWERHETAAPAPRSTAPGRRDTPRPGRGVASSDSDAGGESHPLENSF